MPARDFFRMADISDTSGYKLIREGKFPVPVIAFGSKYFVSRVAVERLMRGESLDRVDSPSTEDASDAA